MPLCFQFRYGTKPPHEPPWRSVPMSGQDSHFSIGECGGLIFTKGTVGISGNLGEIGIFSSSPPVFSHFVPFPPTTSRHNPPQPTSRVLCPPFFASPPSCPPLPHFPHFPAHNSPHTTHNAQHAFRHTARPLCIVPCARHPGHCHLLTAPSAHTHTHTTLNTLPINKCAAVKSSSSAHATCPIRWG